MLILIGVVGFGEENHHSNEESLSDEENIAQAEPEE
jgi:hypothetical protein